MRSTPLLFSLVAFAPSACGEADDGLGPDSTCGLALSVSGAVTGAVEAASVACGSQHGIDAGIDVVFIAPDADVHSTRLLVDEVMRGAIGSFPTLVELEIDDVRYASETCTATIDEHDDAGPAELGRAYRVAGSVECVDPVATADGTATLTIERLDFVVTVTWADR